MAKTEAKILSEIARRRGMEKRTKLVNAEQIAAPLLAYLKAINGMKQAMMAGSYRRRKDTVGDLDILATCDDGVKVVEGFVAYDDVENVLSKGTNYQRDGWEWSIFDGYQSRTGCLLIRSYGDKLWRP